MWSKDVSLTNFEIDIINGPKKKNQQQELISSSEYIHTYTAEIAH